jgi:TonB family protein
MQKVSRILIAAVASAAYFAACAPAARADAISYYTPPKFKHEVKPVYPDSAKAANETGSVLVKVLVAADGTPKQFMIFKSSGHKDLDNAVLTAVKKSTYAPAMRGSTPQTAFYDVTYKFTLSGLAEDLGAQSDLAKKVAANPSDVSARISLGTAYLNHQNYTQAEQVFDAGTQLAAGNAKLWAYKGLAYYQDAAAHNNDVSKYKMSVDAYDQALKLDPKVDTQNIAGSAYFNYGFQLQQSNDNAGALAYAQKAVALDPREAAYFILLGEAQTSQGDYTTAIASLKKAESLDNKKNSIVTARIIADEGRAELMQGDKVNGMADIQRSQQINGQAPFGYEYLYSYYARSGNNAAALTPLMQLSQLQPKEPQWQILIGTTFLNQNNIPSARQACQKALTIKPDSPDAQFCMAEIAAATGDTATVDTTMQKITPGADPKTAAGWEATVALYLLNASQTGKANYVAQAQKYADAATKADPNNGDSWYALGTAQAQQRDKKTDANVSLQKAYDIFKAQNNQDMLKRINDLYKQLNGSNIGWYGG